MTQGTSVVYNPGFPPTTPISGKKSLLRKFSICSFFFSLLTIGGAIGEIFAAKGDIKDCIWVTLDRYPYEKESCSYSRDTISPGIWCSLLPLLASLVGNCSAAKKTKPTKILETCGYPAVGAISMGLLALLELIYLSKYKTIFRTFQFASMVVALLNMTLFIIMSSLMCCMGGCCQVHDDYVLVTEIQAPPPVNGTSADVLTNQAGSNVEASQPQQPTVVVIPSSLENPSLTPTAPSGNDAPPPKYSSIETENFISTSTETPPS